MSLRPTIFLIVGLVLEVLHEPGRPEAAALGELVPHPAEPAEEPSAVLPRGPSRAVPSTLPHAIDSTGVVACPGAQRDAVRWRRLAEQKESRRYPRTLRP
jgi:hypothetical protein